VEDTCREIAHIRDSDTGAHRGEHFEFACGKVPKRSRFSIHGGHVAEIEGPSVFQISGIRVDRGFVSLEVASREIMKRRGPSI
jgi:hypothetical protein